MKDADHKPTRRIDVISLGDTAIDDFIRLFEDKARLVSDGDKEWLGVEYRSKIPFEKSTVVYGSGNAANASVNFAKLGLKSALVTSLGEDDRGRTVMSNLARRGVDTSLVKLHPRKKTNYNYILWYKNDRTILVHHEAYDYRWPHILKSEVPRWIYFSSVADNAVDIHDDVVEWLDQHPDVKLAFQPGTHQLKFGVERLREVYKHTEILILNREEAALVTGRDRNNLHELLDKLHELGPRVVLITDGPSGSYASDGTNRYFMPVYPDVAPPVERTGCGDAYASTFVASLIKGYSLEGALQLAPITPASVVLYPGSHEGLLTTRELKEWLEKAPKDYQAERMN